MSPKRDVIVVRTGANGAKETAALTVMSFMPRAFIFCRDGWLHQVISRSPGELLCPASLHQLLLLIGGGSELNCTNASLAKAGHVTGEDPELGTGLDAGTFPSLLRLIFWLVTAKYLRVE